MTKRDGAPVLEEPWAKVRAGETAPERGRTVPRIRPYRAADRMQVRRICRDTGFLGQPVDAIFPDGDLFADLFTKPYLDYEPDWALVAEEGRFVVGYLLGSVHPWFSWFQLYRGLQTAGRMACRLAAGRYAEHPRGKRFVRWLFTAGWREQPPHPAGAAHLHLNIEEACRGRGVGRRLWETYEHRLRQAGIGSCYGAFFSRPGRRPELVYRRYGFELYSRRRTTLFEPEVQEPVEVVCVRKQLASAPPRRSEEEQ